MWTLTSSSLGGSTTGGSSILVSSTYYKVCTNSFYSYVFIYSYGLLLGAGFPFGVGLLGAALAVVLGAAGLLILDNIG